MSLLHLTPIIPFGPISYMCGGLTSMNSFSFAVANLSSLPLHILYVLIGASAGKLLINRNLERTNQEEINHKLDVDSMEINTIPEGYQDDHERWIVLLGIIMSIMSISVLTSLVRKELNKILKNRKNVSTGEDLDESNESYTNKELDVVVI